MSLQSLFRLYHPPFVIALLFLVATGCAFGQTAEYGSPDSGSPVEWRYLSSENTDIPPPDVGEQVATLIFDVDDDGSNDIVIAGWGKPSMIWFRSHSDGWDRYLIDAGVEYIEAGGAFADVDGDGDLDVVQGGDWRTLKEVWWWENPAPEFDPDRPWTRRLVKNSDRGGTGHHDQIFGDFDGDGRLELAFWNNFAFKLFVAEIPDDLDTEDEWPLTLVHAFDSTAEGKYEGLARGDVDGDGVDDIIGGGHWFRFEGDGRYSAHPIDASYYTSRSAVGDLITGGRPEIVLSSGDRVNSLNWYEWDGEAWVKHTLVDSVVRGHTLELGDINGDGHLDIFCAEMCQWGSGSNPDCRMWIFYGDGRGNFRETLVATGIGNHESKLGDVDGDGDLDIVSKPFMLGIPRLDIWINEGTRDDGSE